jgi:hypothetical protein
MFSNASEAMYWQERNCFRCWKYKDEGSEREKMRCKTAFDIDMGYVGVELPGRVDKITEMVDCPYRGNNRPLRVRREKIPEGQGVLAL